MFVLGDDMMFAQLNLANVEITCSLALSLRVKNRRRD